MARTVVVVGLSGQSGAFDGAAVLAAAGSLVDAVATATSAGNAAPVKPIDRGSGDLLTITSYAVVALAYSWA